MIVAEEVDISYSASVSNAYVPSGFVTSARANGPADIDQDAKDAILGVDVARFGDDKTVLTVRCHRIVFPQVVHEKLDTMAVAAIVKDFVLDWNEDNNTKTRITQIAVDVIGVGAGVVDRLNEFPELEDIQIVGVNTAIRQDDGRNYNLRAKVWRAMKDWLDPRNGPVSLPQDPELETDLTSLQYEYRQSLLLIESKEDAKKRGVKSPDRADSLALTFAEPVQTRSMYPTTKRRQSGGWRRA